MIRFQVFFAVIFVVAQAYTASADDLSDTREAAENRAVAENTGPRALSKAFRNAAKKATPGVVTIFSYGQNSARQPTQQNLNAIPGLTPPKEPENDEKKKTGVGSGVIVSTDGLVITNNHVINGAKRVEVQLADETVIEASRVKGDPASDVAMLRIEREDPFPAVEVGRSKTLEVGDWVLAIGSPFNYESTVSAGIISAKNRPLDRIKRGRMLQTDAAINPGNSGGPLIDLDGKVIGISTAIATRNGGYQGIGFAIPIDQAKWIADELDQHGEVRRAAIGGKFVELKPKNAKLFKLPAYLGVLAYQIIKDSAADRAGIKQLDVILEFAGERVRSNESLQEVIERMPVGSTQDVKIYRKGKELTLQIELATVEDPTRIAEAVAETETETSDEETSDADPADAAPVEIAP